MDDALSIALPKGRLGGQVYELLERAGFGCPGVRDDVRKLIFKHEAAKIRYFWAKPTDVPIYVERGAADIGIVGKDVLAEYAPDVYELLDLGLGRCRMAVAAKAGFRDATERTLRVATKFPNIAGRYYAGQGRAIDIIRLSGSIELAPVLDMSDVIVDIVETGSTLRENHLVELETILELSARLIVNKANFKFKTARIQKLCAALRDLISGTEGLG